LQQIVTVAPQKGRQARAFFQIARRRSTMSAFRWGCALLLTCASVTNSFASRPDSWDATVRAQSAPSENVQRLTKRQVEAVRRVNDYFNQLTMVQGSFIQTSAEGKRQRGVFHIMRPSRFRFDFAPPDRVVVVSDGKQLAVQEYNLKTDDRRDLNQTGFRALLRADVDLLRDSLILDVSETNDTLMIAFTGVSSEPESIRLFLSIKPVFQLKGWIIRDNQNIDTKVDLAEVQPVSTINPKLFDLSARLERQW
jgi:outer membrane lipoprotein-sorting protein